MMHERPPRPEQFHLPDVASDGVEAIDLQILVLLSQRFALAGMGPTNHIGNALVGDGDHRRATLSRIRRKAFELGIPVSLVTDFWDRMLEASEAMHEQRLRRMEG